jgi:hypothetical protein
MADQVFQENFVAIGKPGQLELRFERLEAAVSVGFSGDFETGLGFEAVRHDFFS